MTSPATPLTDGDTVGVDSDASAGSRTVRGALKRTMPEPEPEERDDSSSGWRTSRRGSRSGKRARRQAKVDRVKGAVSEGAAITADATWRVLKAIALTVLGVAVVAVTLWGLALGINAFARWNAKRLAAQNATTSLADAAKDNLLVIGVDGQRAIGFLAMKADRASKRVYGIAIPDGAFVEVPGQGFERIGASYSAGPDVAKDAVSNYLFVPFRRYAVVDSATYQQLLKKQQISGLLAAASATDLTATEKDALSRFLATVPTKDVWIAPLPVTPIAVGDQRYYEPQRSEIADLLLQWWNVKVSEKEQTIRVMIYNGVGTPGVAGKAAQQLIRQGFRVVDSKNADNFNYKRTEILLYHGTQADARRVREALGVGDIRIQKAPQDLTDIIVVIGSDYVVPTSGG